MQNQKMPDHWEKLLKSYIKKTFYAGTRRSTFADRTDFTEGDYRFFASGVEKLNKAFTLERHSLPRNYFNQKELRSGYLLYFLPNNAIKAAGLLEQMPPDAFPVADGASLKILDIGSGPGTGLLGTMAYLEKRLKMSGRRSPSEVNGEITDEQMGGRRGESGISHRPRIQLDWILIDQNRQAMEDASAIYEEALENLRKNATHWKIESHLKKITADLFSERLGNLLKPEPMDLILSLNFLNEFPREKRLPLVEILLKNYLKPKGKILLMEPALRQTTRDLMMLRDQLLERRAGFVFGPCLHQAGCPMLRANDRDWCHTYIPWERPAWIEKIDRLVRIKKDYLKCSYLLLGKNPAPTYPPEVWRVVSGPLNSKGKTERLLCGPGGLPDLLRGMRLDRDQSEANRDFDRLERGDIVRLQKSQRIDRSTPVKKEV